MEFPPMDDERHLILVLKTILEVREKKLWSRVIMSFLFGGRIC